MRVISKPHAGDRIGTAGNQSVTADHVLQQYLDDLEEAANRTTTVAPLGSFTVANLPDTTRVGLIFVSDETGGAVVAFSDGTNWRRVTDRAIVS